MPGETRDAARGMGLTERQLLWRVELPLALPDIIAGLRIATTTTVGLATLAFFAGAGGLGGQIFGRHHVQVRRGRRGRAVPCCCAVVLDVILLTAQRLLTPWRRARPA